MWRLLSVLTLCGMPSLRADVCGGLPASPPQRLGYVEALRSALLPVVRKARRISVPHYGSSIVAAQWGWAGRRRYSRRRY
jgi:hypothetical protein